MSAPAPCYIHQSAERQQQTSTGYVDCTKYNAICSTTLEGNLEAELEQLNDLKGERVMAMGLDKLDAAGKERLIEIKVDK